MASVLHAIIIRRQRKSLPNDPSAIFYECDYIEETSDVFHYLLGCINHALTALSQDLACKKMAVLAKGIHDAANGSCPEFDAVAAEKWIKTEFLLKLFKALPPVYVEKELKHVQAEDIGFAIACTPEQDCYDSGHAIYLNAAIVDDLARAASKFSAAPKTSTSSKAPELLQTTGKGYVKCMFMITFTLMHEVQHLIKAHLVRSRIATPIDLTIHPLWHPRKGEGEAGHFITKELVEGIPWIQPQLGLPNNDPGIPWLFFMEVINDRQHRWGKEIKLDAMITFLRGAMSSPSSSSGSTDPFAEFNLGNRVD